MLIILRTQWNVFERDVLSCVKSILHHICCWVNPDWVYPAAASKDLRDFLWDTEIRDILFNNDQGTPEQAPTTMHKDSLSRSQEFVHTIIDAVQNDTTWRDDKLNKQVRSSVN